MTKTVNTAGKIVAFVEIEEDARDFYIDRSNLLFDLSDNKADLIKLPVGNWQILGDSRTLTESDIKPLVVQVGDEWRSAIELWSLLKEANGIVDSNPLPDPELTMRQGDGYVYYGAADEEFAEYDRIESLVKRLLVLVSQE